MQMPAPDSAVRLTAPPKLAAPSHERWPALIVLAGLVGATLVLYGFNPTDYGIYPACVLHRFTGLDCPGCGTLRAAHQFLHGHWGTAFALNPLAVVLGPLVSWSLGAWLLESLLGWKVKQPFSHPAWAWGIGAVAIIFGIARNLPLLHAAGLVR